MRMVYLFQFEIRKKYIVFRVCSNGMENFSYYEYLNSLNILYMRMVYLYQFEILKKDIVSKVCF